MARRRRPRRYFASVLPTGAKSLRPPPFARYHLPRRRLSIIEDRRRWNPLRFHRRMLNKAVPARVVIARTKRKVVPRALRYANPHYVVHCIRRKVRQEVLHALNITGRRGVGAGKKRRTTPDSHVRC